MSFISLGDHTQIFPILYQCCQRLLYCNLNPKAYTFIDGHIVAAYPCCRGPDPKNTMARIFQGLFLFPARLAGFSWSRLVMAGVKMGLKERLFQSVLSRGSGR